MIRFNMFLIFQINKINFEQYLKVHKHPDTFIQKCDAMTQTDYTTIRPKPFLKNLSNRMRTPLEKKNLVHYWTIGHRMIMIRPMMNFKRTLPKHFLIKILHTKPILTWQFSSHHSSTNPDCYSTTPAVWTPQH